MNSIQERKAAIEEKLAALDISHTISEEAYLNFDASSFQSTYDAGCRMMILYGLAYAAEYQEDRRNVKGWFKREMIWMKLSKAEKEFLSMERVPEEVAINLTWRMEGAYVLAWALNVMEELPNVIYELMDHRLEEFAQEVPPIGDPLDDFLKGLTFRALEEIYDENLSCELITAHFRDVHINDKEVETEANPYVAYERHRALNWLRKFGTTEDWDNVDTSA